MSTLEKIAFNLANGIRYYDMDTDNYLANEPCRIYNAMIILGHWVEPIPQYEQGYMADFTLVYEWTDKAGLKTYDKEKISQFFPSQDDIDNFIDRAIRTKEIVSIQNTAVKPYTKKNW
jgi:hypothetical protein